MKMVCEWCDSEDIKSIKGSVFWELPDGTRAIEITETPTLSCNSCNMIYQSEQIVKDIENQLFLIDCRQIEKMISFEELMSLPRLLKKNYFDFT
jgi:uncharacterized YokU family protein